MRPLSQPNQRWKISREMRRHPQFPTHDYIPERIHQPTGKELARLEKSNHREALYDVLGGRCWYCHDIADPLTIDHFVAVSKGGADSLENMVPACESCNRLKGSHPADHFLFKTVRKDPRFDAARRRVSP
jgi:5-methylcytosine-specific restriction endonuclease McrA